MWGHYHGGSESEGLLDSIIRKHGTGIGLAVIGLTIVAYTVSVGAILYGLTVIL